jgi:hypothetical protein
MPIRVWEMRPAIPLTALLTILLSTMVAGFIHARNRLTELFLGFYGCCVHRILHGTKGGAARKGRIQLASSITPTLSTPLHANIHPGVGSCRHISCTMAQNRNAGTDLGASASVETLTARQRSASAARVASAWPAC